MHRGHLIVVCGCIGAGKSTAVKLLSDALGVRGEVENYAANPFLESFYAEPARWAFHSQMYFVLEMLDRTYQPDGGGEGLIRESCVTFVLDVMCRELEDRGWLSRDEMALLRGAARVAHEPMRPDLYLHLDAEATTLRERIAARGRRMERQIDIDYLDSLRRRYRMVLDGLPGKVLTVRTDNVDMREPAGLAHVVEMIEKAIDARSITDERAQVVSE